MENEILHEPSGISSRIAVLALLLLITPVLATASPLFEDDAALDIRLSGPLGTIAKEKKGADRVEYPFVLSVAGRDIPVRARVRGNSRTIVCGFPPLRLNFSSEDTAATIFAGQDKLKLVTHCRNGRQRFENNLLEEYTAYRIFNRITEIGYRVRLLRIRYDDTDANLDDLEQTYFGFLIESDEELAARLDAGVVRRDGVPYTLLDDAHTARFYIFQYMIGNFDWSFILADGAEYCCHNVDLVERDGRLFAIPYDFDFSGMVNASYAKPPEIVGTKRVTQRVYRGYCKLPLESVASALTEIVAMRDDIIALVAGSPVAGDDDTDARVRYIDYFFTRATEDRDELLNEFDSDCLGPH